MDGDERRKVRFGGGSSDEDEGMEMQERKVPVLKINSDKGKDKYKDLFVIEPSSSDEEDDETDQVRFRLPQVAMNGGDASEVQDPDGFSVRTRERRPTVTELIYEAASPDARQKQDVGVSLALERLNVWLRKKTVKEVFACGEDRKRKIKKQTTKHMLRDIDGVIHPGQLLAIMGGSGSGKTTLLNVLAGRVKHGTSMGFGSKVKIDGRIIFEGYELNPKEAKQVVGYVLQHDHLLPHLTVRETLQYAGYLRLPSSIPHKKKKLIVEEVIRELGLKECANRRVGGDGSHGISGGQRRRVSIGIQMLTNPSVLFLDEPTSGLDSFTATSLIETLHAITRQGKTVICTIHQPQSYVFKLFDSVMLLSKGREIYFGPTTGMLPYFEGLGLKCPSLMNPADFVLDMVTVDSREEELCLQRIDALSSYFRASRVRKEVQAEIEEEKELSLEGRKRFGLTQSSDDWMTMQKLDRDALKQSSSGWLDKIKQSGTISRAALQRTLSGRWRSSSNMMKSGDGEGENSDRIGSSASMRRSQSSARFRSGSDGGPNEGNESSDRIGSSPSMKRSSSSARFASHDRLDSSLSHQSLDDSQSFRPSVEDLSSYFPVTKSLAQSKEMRRKEKDASYPDFMETPLSPRRQRANTVTTRGELMGQVRAKKANYLIQTGVLTHRGFKHLFRNYAYLVSQLLETVLMAIAMGLIFLQVGDGSKEDIQGRLGAIFGVVGLQPYVVMLTTMLHYEEELKVFSREQHDNMVSVLPYFLSMLATSFPFAVIMPIIFSSIYYWMTGLRPEWDAFLWFTLCVFLAQYVAESLGFLFIALTRTFATASLAANSFVSFWNLCTGYLINPDTFIIYLEIIGYTSYLQYTYAAMAVNELKDNMYDCPSSVPEECLGYDGNVILKQQHLVFTEMGPCLGVLAGMAVGFRLISLLLLYIIKKSPA